MPRRLLRLKTESYYHCVSRVVEKNRCLREDEKRHFHDWMRRLERFCGVQVVTYCLMENHFHLLVRVPCRDEMVADQPLTEARLRELLPLIYRGRELLGAVQELDRAAAYAGSTAGSGNWLQEILDRYEARRYSLSVFLKEMKQRYTRWHNRKYRRVGTLWENRFRSVLVEGDEKALLTVAAYIDLNPVRAGIVADPKDYRWCGYAEAVGSRGVSRNRARKGLCTILERTSFGVNRRVNWRITAPRYRMLLFGHGERRDLDEQTGAPGRLGMSREEVEVVLSRGGEMSLSEILRCKVRYFTGGIAVGSAQFLESVFEEHRERFGRNRTIAGKAMRGADWGGLKVLRNLRCGVSGSQES
jgi:REP element-mobilizing transposase RayT